MVTTDVNTVTYNGDGSTTAFPFTFKIQDASEINLQLVQDDDTVTDITSDFYVDTVNSTVYYPGYAPGAEPPEADQPPKVQTGQKLTIWRDVPMTQENDLGDKWPFHEIEDGLDKLTMIAQQIFSYTNRKLDAALASMFQLAGIVTDSGKLQHITDQYNAIDANAAAAAESADDAEASAAMAKKWANYTGGVVADGEYSAKKYATDAGNSATNAANSDASATATAAALTAYLDTKETLTAPAVDATLTISGAAADAKVTGEMLSNLNKAAFITNDMSVAATSSGWKLDPDTGLCTSDANYKLIKYTVTAGDYVKIVSDNYFQFQTVASVPSSGSSNRVGDTFVSGTFYKEVPTGATYLIMSTPTTDSAAKCYSTTKVSSVVGDLIDYSVTWNSGYYNLVANAPTSSDNYKYCKIDVTLYRGGLMVGTTGVAPNDPALGIAFVDDYNNLISSAISTNTGHYNWSYSLTVPANAQYAYINLRIASEDLWVKPSFDLTKVFPNIASLFIVGTQVENINKKVDNIVVPNLRNGSVGNSLNANAITSKYIIPIKHEYDEMMIQFNANGSIDVNEYAFAYSLFKDATDGMTTTEAFSDADITKQNVNSNADIVQLVPYVRIPITTMRGYDHISVCIFVKKNGVVVPLRIAQQQQTLKITFKFADGGSATANIETELNNARHIQNSSAVPLTLVHFSDIHADASAMGRIVKDASQYVGQFDGMICTGDMVLNTAGQITSWWDENVMTCIGNHDSASYSDGTYDWTALSMADRDAYYIAPFESNWGITHTSGTSYYYKDYATQKVRLIVMDGQLYINAGAEATAQTSWLASLLTDAITNNLHVLIAIHAPHGGATAKECSFSKYGGGTRPVYSDSNTPQVVIDTVHTAISNGLHFIGYLVGHTHQDNIWDAENDGEQLMYCITCAAVVQTAQWTNSDQHRSDTEDAYNLVTIDTANTLVKIIRGGGADIDDHMRTRKAICFNYSNGTIVGEVL